MHVIIVLYYALPKWYVQVVVLHELIYWLAVTRPTIHVNSAVVYGEIGYMFWELCCNICNEIGCLNCIVLATSS